MTSTSDLSDISLDHPSSSSSSEPVTSSHQPTYSSSLSSSSSGVSSPYHQSESILVLASGDDDSVANSSTDLSYDQRQANARARQFAATFGQPEQERPGLPFGVKGTTLSNEVDDNSVTPSSSSSVPSDPLEVRRAVYVGRTPPPPFPDYQVLGVNKAVGVKGRLFWAGLKVFNAMEFVGEVFADFFGLYDSKYQYVVDAYERNAVTLALERQERKEQRKQERLDRNKEPTRIIPETLTNERKHAHNQKMNADHSSNNLATEHHHATSSTDSNV